jgi:hypothetical protein
MKAIGSATPAKKLAALALFLSFAVAASFGVTPPPVSFVARMDYAVGSNPEGIAMADLNSDGNLDLVTLSAFSSPGSVSVLLGKADGTFQPAANYSVPASSTIFELGDFNNDGKLDILVASQAASPLFAIVSVSVLLGNGDGTFQPQKVTTIANSNCGCLAVGNFHGDGTLDIALPVSVPQVGDSALAVMRGNGDGTFQVPVVVNPGPFPTPTYFRTADFDNDGKLDLISGVFNPGISVFLGKGDGTFQPPISTTIALGFSLVVADFTRDGKLDVACFDCGSVEGVAVLPGNGDGTFGPPISTDLANNGGGGVAMFSADVNGDGKQDLVLLGFDGGGANAVLLGNGNGTFQSPGLGISPTVLPGTLAAFGDFNKDGKLDIATVTSFSSPGVASVAFGNGDGTFQFDTVISNLGPDGGYAVSALAGNFTGHGNMDLLEMLAFTEGDSAFVVLPANGNGTFQSPTPDVFTHACPAASPPGLEPCAAVAVDFNGDGKLDFAITTNTGPVSLPRKIGVFLGNGDGTFQSEVDYSGGGNAIVLGDVNNDRIPDIITAGDGTDNVYFMLGKGDGTFGFTNTVPISAQANAVAVAEFNRDGNLDLAVGLPSGVAILPGNGKGAFGPEADIALAAGATTLAVGDFKGDGNIGIVAGNSSSNIVSVLLNTGGGVFSAPVTYPVVGPVVYVAVGDFNGDGIPDLAILNSISVVPIAITDVSILVGNGDGTFQPAVSFGTSNFSDTQFAIADLNGDGSPDIAVGNSLLFNRPASPAATLAPSLVAFGNTAVGSPSAPQTVTLNNTSSAALTISGITITGPQSSEFKETNTCGTGIAAGANCTIAITFTPAAVGSGSATVNVADNAAHGLHAVGLRGTGVSLGLGASSPSATVPAGQTAKYTLSIGGGGFSGTVTLACSGVPPAAKCTVPASENVSPTTPTTFPVTVVTMGPATAAAHPPSAFPRSGWPWTLALVGIVILPISGWRRTSRLLSGLPILLLLIFICSCGGSSSHNCGTCSSGTPPGKYTVIVTATSGSMSQSLPLTLIVQ